MSISRTLRWSTAYLEILAENRVLGLLTGFAVGFHLFLSFLKLPVYVCPLKSVTGLKCPGCGMSEAVLYLIRGDFSAAFEANPFAPYFMLFGALLVVISLSGEAVRRKLWRSVMLFESYTRFNAVVLLTFAGYGTVRMLLPLAAG